MSSFDSSHSVDSHYDPRQVFIFSGHMIDKPGRPVPRFPHEKEQAAKQSIATVLDRLDATAGDLGICGGACGGDILFGELCLAHNMQLRICLPQEEHEFIAESVSFAGEHWVERFHRLKAHSNTIVTVLPRVAGESPGQADPYERNNTFQLRLAAGAAGNRQVLVALWDGRAGDGPGGTAHMIDAVRKAGGQVHIISTESL